MADVSQEGPPRSGRHAAAVALVRAARRFPHLTPSTVTVENLSHSEAQLAVAIHRTVLQRWLTLTDLLDRFTKPATARLEPSLRAVLLVGAAQLLFLPRQPAYAVVSESVELARRLVRPGAAGMVNAVLRKLAGLIAQADSPEPWQPAADRLPTDEGCVILAQPCLPDPTQPVRHLAVATSHPPFLLKRWIEAFGLDRAAAYARQGVRTPPVIVAVEEGFDRDSSAGPWQPHEQAGFLVWQGTHTELTAFLAGHVARRVQDPASAQAVALCRGLSIRTALDYCAGRGTKTRQLALEHPQARVWATDPHAGRRQHLEELARALPHVQAVSPQQALRQQVDLLLVDVPCSNTGVLARRPEARYRLNRQSLDQLLKLQRQILTQAARTVRPDGHILYSTCSLEAEENQHQARWLAQQVGGQILREEQTFPDGQGHRYHDGGYAALIRRS